MTRTVVDCLKTARLAAKQAPDHVENWLALGQLYQLDEQLDEARRSFEQGWAAAADQQRWSLYVTLAERLMDLYQQQGRNREFVMVGQRILRQSWLEPYGLQPEAVLLRLAQYFLAVKNMSAALHYAGQALVLAENLRDHQTGGDANFVMGQVFRHQSQLDRAESHFHKALEIAGKQQNAARMANLYSVLASIHQQREEWAEAEEMQNKGIRIGKLLKQQAGLASDYANLAISQLKQQRLKEARENLTEALTLYRSLDNPRGEADQLANLGIVATLEEKLDEADVSLQQAWQLYHQIDYRRGIEQVTRLLVDLAQLQRPSATLQ